ncbi:MAG: ROK family protein [Halanaerobiales bacterium]
MQKAANLKSWKNSKIFGVLQDEFDCEVCVHSVVYAALLGEKCMEKQKNSENFIKNFVGIGVGMGIFIDNSIYIGANGLAGGDWPYNF